MRLIRVVLCTTVFVTASVSVSFAQSPGPCASDCSGLFMPPVNITVMIDAGCTVTLSCQKRVCAGTYELNVLSASYAGACSLWTAGGRIQQALNMIVHQNLMNFQPGAPSAAGTYHWRISRPACWQSNEGVLSACSDECCVNNLDVVKKTGCADFQVATETVLSPPRACPPSYYDNEDVLNFPNCTPACGAFYPAPGARP